MELKVALNVSRLLSYLEFFLTISRTVAYKHVSYKIK